MELIQIKECTCGKKKKYRLDTEYQTYLSENAQNDAEQEYAGCRGILHIFL